MRALALVEHVDRELDLVCLLKLLLKRRHGIDLDVVNFYADAPLTLAGQAPRVVLTPFFYAVEDMVMQDYVRTWPETRFLNLAWEQVFYPSHQAIKAPRDKFTRKKVTHLAWSQTFADYLGDNGVAPERVRRVGHALYRLYGEPYQRYFESRASLAREFALNPNKRWVFVPENYRWAFFTDAKLRKLGRRGVEQDELFHMRDFCRHSLSLLMQWCDALARRDDVEVIFRPRPATSVEEITRFSSQVFGGRAPAFGMIKGRSARDWVIASDVVTSSYSTVLIEGALAGKTLVRIAPEPIPDGLRYDWCDLVPPVVDEAEFLAACLRDDQATSAAPLRDWADATFFADGDPVERVVETIAAEVKSAYGQSAPPRADRSAASALPLWLRAVAPAVSPGTRHDLFAAHAPGYFFNRGTHEKDLFDGAEIRRRVAHWSRSLRT